MTRPAPDTRPYPPDVRRRAIALAAGALLALAHPVPAATPILVIPAGAPRSVPLFGYDTDRATAVALAEPGFRAAIRNLRPAVVRYPGGAIAMYWDGMRGRRTSNVPIPGDHPPPVRRAPLFRPEEFARIVAATGAEPVWNLNVVTSSPGREIALLRRAKTLGLPVRHVMLGDRIFAGSDRGSHAAIRYPSPIAYARAANAWALSIRRHFPETRIAVSLAPWPLPGTMSRASRWNREVLPTVAHADAVVAPVFVSAGRRPVGIADLPVVLAASTYRAQTARWHLVDRLPSGAGECWATEYARLDAPGRTNLAGTWAHALLAVSLAMHLIEDPRATMLIGPPLAGTPAYSVLVRDDDRGRWRLTALGTAIEALNASAAGMRDARVLAFAPNPLLHEAGDDSTAFALQGWVFRAESGAHEAVVVNRSGSWHALAVDSLAGRRRYRWERLSASPLVPGAPPRRERGAMAGTFPVRPWSITRIRWDVAR